MNRLIVGIFIFKEVVRTHVVKWFQVFLTLIFYTLNHIYKSNTNILYTKSYL